MSYCELCQQGESTSTQIIHFHQYSPQYGSQNLFNQIQSTIIIMSNQKKAIALLLDPRAEINKIKDEGTIQIPRPLNIDPSLIIPISKVSSQVVAKLTSEPIPEIILPAYSSIQEASHIYFKEYCKLFHTNQTLNNDLVDAISDRNLLADKYNQIKRMRFSDEAVRRKRRYARDIDRVFFCPMEKCNRGYGSEGSLSHHVRLKHLDFYQSGKYQIFIQNYLDNKLPDIKRKLQEKQKQREKKPIIRQGRLANQQLIVVKKKKDGDKTQNHNDLKQEQS